MKTTDTSNADLAAKILTWARSLPATGRFHGDKAYISAVYAVACDPRLSLAEFKAVLVELNQANLLDLSRADLVEAMPAALVAASEIDDRDQWGGSQYHFIRIG